MCIKWLLLLVTFPCWANSTYQNFHKDMNSTTTVRDAANIYVRVCSTPIYNIQQDETLQVFSSVNTTNETEYVIGVTSEVFFCDLDAVNCRRKLLNTDANQLDGGNITPEEHHKVYKPYARLTAGYYVPNILVANLIRVYSTGEAVGTKLNITSCDLDIERK